MPCLYNGFVTCNNFSKSRNLNQRPYRFGEQEASSASGDAGLNGVVTAVTAAWQSADQNDTGVAKQEEL
jgi:hypothetical protein